MARGDHIKVKRFFGLFYHHGIDVGDGTVIHFNGEPSKKSNASVKQTSMEEFLDGRELEFVHYSKSLDPIITINMAKKQIGLRGYNLFYRNCEHFATNCKLGKKESKQVKRLLNYCLNSMYFIFLGFAFYKTGVLWALAKVTVLGTTIVNLKKQIEKINYKEKFSRNIEIH